MAAVPLSSSLAAQWRGAARSPTATEAGAVPPSPQQLSPCPGAARGGQFGLISALLDAGFPSPAGRFEEPAHGSWPLDAAGSPDAPRAEFLVDPSAGKVLGPDKTPQHGICRLIAATVGAEEEELPGGRVLWWFQLRDGEKKLLFC